MHLCVGRHPNVVELRALAQQGSALYMVMEYFPRGTLEVRGLHLVFQQLPSTRFMTLKTATSTRPLPKPLLRTPFFTPDTCA